MLARDIPVGNAFLLEFYGLLFWPVESPHARAHGCIRARQTLNVKLISLLSVPDRGEMLLYIHISPKIGPTDRRTDRPTDGPTDGRTDRPTDRPTCRPAGRPTCRRPIAGSAEKGTKRKGSNANARSTKNENQIDNMVPNFVGIYNGWVNHATLS